jgi:hypothetical protein
MSGLVCMYMTTFEYAYLVGICMYMHASEARHHFSQKAIAVVITYRRYLH